MAAFDGSGGEAVKQRSMAIALLAAVLVMTTLMGCAPGYEAAPAASTLRLDAHQPRREPQVRAVTARTRFYNDDRGPLTATSCPTRT